MVTLYYKPGSSVRCSSGEPDFLVRALHSGPRAVLVFESSPFVECGAGSQGCHVSIGLQLWAVGLALVIMPGDLGVYAAEVALGGFGARECIHGAG